MQFKVPQFIEVEDTIFGPFTFKQFAYMAGGGGMIFLLLKLLPTFIGVILSIPVAIFTALMVFYKINGKSFVYYLQAGLNYLTSNKLYLWKQRLVKPDKTKESDSLNVEMVSVLPMTSSLNKIKDLSFRLDVQEEEEKEIKN